MSRFFLKDCQPGDLVEDVFVFTNKQISTTTSGKFFIKGFIGDRTLQVTARKWNATREEFNQMPDNGFVWLRGRIENYQNNLQLIVEDWAPPEEGSFHVGDLLPHTQKDIPAMFKRICEIGASFRNKHVRAIVKAFLDDAQLMKNFQKSPAAMSFHHAYIGGLLEHTLNAMEVADVIVPFYPGLSRDLVVSGIFLHDLAKTWELKYETAFGYTDSGQLIGHIVKITLWLEEKAKIAAEQLGEPIPREVIDVMQHIALSHHGEPEFGAARVPSTPEAIAVHMIENMDAKLMMSLGATRNPDAPGEGNWTDYLKAFSTRMYRPDVAPPDENFANEDAPAAKDAPVADPAKPLAITNPLFGEFGKKK